VSLEQLAAWLFGRTSGGVRWGIERTAALLAEAGNPQTSFRSLHVGGTNGKGSVAALCAAALHAPGVRRIGLYTSPHLVSFSERIRIDGQPIDDGALLAAAERLRPAIERTGATFFEATTAIAFLCMAEAGVEVAVIEVGLGGRLDATNVIVPLAAAITNVAFDHTEYLGTTLAAIAAEKAGILKLGVPAITGVSQPEALQVVREAALAAGAPLVHLDDAVVADEVQSELHGSRLRIRSAFWGERTLWLPLAGGFQVRNALLAAELLALLPDELRPGWDALHRGFASVRWPGRLQLERVGGTTYLFDVAHNPAGMEALCAALDTLEIPGPRVVVVGILADKNWRAMLPPLLGRADASILTVPPSAPAAWRWDPAAAAAGLGPGAATPVHVIDDLGRALERAVTLAPYGTVVVTGSVYTVGDAMAHLGVLPFGSPGVSLVV
jgi:dihydrofolate synthase / folylpolyglutamate synthase